MTRSLKTTLAAAMLAVAGVAFVANPARTADHRDAPSINQDATADINDVYAFVNPNNPTNVVLAMTVNPFVVPGVGASFSDEVLYQFKIDNTGDAREDLVIQTTFTKASSQGTGQQFTLRGPSRPAGAVGVINLPLGRRRTGVTVTGPANGTVVPGSNGVRVFAGLRDDPFFFDLVYVFRLLGIQSGGPLSRAPGIDFFAGINCSILAVELPGAMLRGSNGNKIGFWGTTSRARITRRQPNGTDRNQLPFVQVERMGLPVINTVLIGRQPGTAARKDAFNRSAPENDRRLFRAEALQALLPLNGNNQAYSEQLLNALMPDILPFDTTSTQGFAQLNGRRPQDDVIDIVLSLASNGGVTSDAVNANDRPFLNDFPFFAPPHEPSEAIPPRN